MSGSVKDRAAVYAAMRDAIMRHLWSEDNIGLTVKVLAEGNGFGETQVAFQLKTLSVQGLVYAQKPGKVSTRSQELNHMYTDNPARAKRFLALAAGENTTYIQKPNIWFLTEAGLKLFGSEE